MSNARVCTACAIASDGNAVTCIHRGEEPAAVTDDRLFTMGMVVQVAEVIEAQGYDMLSDRELVELQQHLFHFLHGRGRGDDHCTGGVR